MLMIGLGGLVLVVSVKRILLLSLLARYSAPRQLSGTGCVARRCTKPSVI